MASIVLAVLSTVAYALAALHQRIAAIAEARLVDQLRRPAWWLSVVLLGTGALLHVAALRYGPLTLVQPLGALTLVFAVPLAARTQRRAPTRDEWLGVVASVLGLATLLALTRPTGTAHALSGATTGLIVMIMVSVLAAVWLVSRGAGRAQGVCLAFAAGTASAIASSFTPALLAGRRWQEVVPMLSALAIFIVAGMLFSQLSFRRSLSAPLATATITNPVVAAVFGVLVLGEQATSSTTATTLGLLAALVACAGIVLLARSSAASMAHT